jgi:CIC family chloride channel protein
MLGMAAMMAATLQAPLAAIICLLELTTNQEIILPGMTAVVIACVITRVVFKKESIYRHLLLNRGLDYRNSSMSIALRRVGVANVMERNIIQLSTTISYQKAAQILQEDTRWILLNDIEKKNKNSLFPSSDLARYLSDLDNDYKNNEIDLFKIPAKRLDVRPIKIIATLQEAYELMQSSDCHALFITGANGATKQRIYGVITQEQVENSYRI